MLAVEGIEADEELVLARDLTSALIKTVKGFRFYPADNPTLKAFRDQLLKKFQFFLSKYQVSLSRSLNTTFPIKERSFTKTGISRRAWPFSSTRMDCENFGSQRD